MDLSTLNWLLVANPAGEYLIAFTVLFAIVLVGGMAAMILRRDIFPDNPVRAQLSRRFGMMAAVVGAVGLVLVLAGFAAVPVLGMPVLLTLPLIAIPALAGYIGYYLRTHYTALVVARQAEDAKRKYMTPQRTQGSSQRRAKKRRRSR